MPTTEVASFPLKAGSNPGDPDNHAAGITKSTFDTLRQQDGMQQIHFGTGVEDPTLMQLMINWDSKKHHEDFIASDTYGPFFKHFGSMVAGDASIHHVDFQPAGALSRCFSAPVTEVATFYFEGAPPSGYLEGVEKLRKILAEEKPDGYLEMAAGITHEEIEREGVKGKGAVVTIGWESVDKHMQFRNSQSFKDNIHLLRSEAKKIQMYHVQFMQAQ